MTIALWMGARITSSWSIFESHTFVKLRSIETLQSALGYGGMIHSLKNYVLRRDPEFIDRFEASCARARTALAEYGAAPGLTDKERRSLATLSRLILSYEAALASVSAESAIGDADHRARVEDAEFIAALQTLRETIDSERTAAIGRLTRDLDTAAKSALAIGTAALIVVIGVNAPVVFFVQRRLARSARVAEEQRERMERASEGSTDGFWDYEPATGEVWYSDQFKRLIGLAPNQYDSFEPTLESFTNLLHPHDRERTLEAIESHLSGRSPYDVQYRLRLPGGEYRWFHARGRATRDDNGAVLRLSGSITDIQDQHTTKSRLELALASARAGLWDWSVREGTFRTNETFHAMLGEPPISGPIPLGHFAERLHPDDVDRTFDTLEKAQASDEFEYEVEFRLRCADGTYRWIRSTGAVIERDENGTALRMIGQHIDIHESRQALAAAKAANQAKSEFLANMSHEIRTPMTAILGYTDLLDSDAAESREMQREAVQTIRSNAQHLLTIINDILDMSKIEAGRMSVERIAMNPAQIVEEVVSLVRPRASGKGIGVNVAYDTPIPERIESDATRLRQILLNLTGNAIKFTEVGSVTIHAACDPEGERMEFSVVDTGIGMSPEQCEAIARFEAFSQADTSTARRFGGTGLGLRISNSLARLLGGWIDVKSQEGSGSTFTLSIATGSLEGVPMLGSDQILSMPGPARTQEQEPRRTTERLLEGARILLAEDGPDNQRLISYLLKKAGADVQLADNGRIAAEAIEGATPETLPELVLMDMQMPELDGYGAMRRLRRQGCTIPIVALTAHAMDGDRQKCLDAGADDYLTKPVDKNELIEVCRRWRREAACSQDNNPGEVGRSAGLQATREAA
jgi:PAS domain S-box-containing protein